MMMIHQSHKKPASCNRRWNEVLKDLITLSDYEVHDGTNIDLYYEDAYGMSNARDDTGRI